MVEDAAILFGLSLIYLAMLASRSRASLPVRMPTATGARAIGRRRVPS